MLSDRQLTVLIYGACWSVGLALCVLLAYARTYWW